MMTPVTTPATFVDTSAWIEFLRDAGSPACLAVDQLLATDLVICDVVSMEVLAGARDDRHLLQLRSLLARGTSIPVTSEDHDQAASLYRSCRKQGEIVRKMLDCLIAAVAIRHGLPLLHADVDFDVLARHTRLTIVSM